MRACIITLCCWVSLLAMANAQSYTTSKTAGDKAKKAYQDGLSELSDEHYAIAIGFFEKAIKLDSSFIDAHLMWAGSQYEVKDFERAEKGFEKVLAIDPAFEPRVFYSLAVCEWNQDKFEDAARHANQYLQSNSKNEGLRRDAKRLVENGQFAAEAVKHPVPFNPESVGDGVNTKFDEYLPSLTADGQTLIFTRQENWDENFYVSEKKDGVWQTAEAMEAVNTSQNEGAEQISPDGTWLVFTACDRKNDGSQGSCDLYWSQQKSSGWSKPSPFSNSINSPQWDAQPCITADGKSIYFSSERPGGVGGKDLWVTTRQAGGKWSAPQNLGKTINTPGEEQTPYMHPDGQTLYFTSDGLPGMGKNDLYVVRRDPDGNWGTPQNLGYPINTKAQEGTLVVSLDGRKAYFAAIRPGGRGANDIYVFDLPESARPKPVTYARVHVTDAATGNAVSAKVDFIDLQSGQSYTTANTRKDGSALVCLPAGKDYALNVSKDKYFFYSENFNLLETATFAQPFLLEVALNALPDSTAHPTVDKKAGRPIILRNVFFATGSASLLPESSVELDRLAKLLQDNNWLRIQINGHTDDVGDERSNLTLSENRAKSVYDYLLSKGIPAERLRFKGFGESQPVDDSNTTEARQKNRRSEFIVW